jgi:hypothetical protein
MAKNSPGWTVQITGNVIDFDDLKEHLAPPFDSWVEIFAGQEPPQVLLRSAKWASLTEARDVDPNSTMRTQV